MADDWDADDAVIDEPVVDKWADEDAEEPTVDDWDADPVETPAVSTAPKQPTGPVISERKRKKMAEDEKKRKEAEELAAATDPKLRAAKKMAEVQMARARDATLAASLLGVDPADPDYQPPVGMRDDGSDIAGGVSELSLEDKASLAKATNSFEIDLTDDVAIEKLTQQIIKKAVTLPSSNLQSAQFLLLLKNLTNGIGDLMKVDHLTELRRIVNVKHTEMTNKQKVAQKGKKAAAPAAAPKKANTVKVASAASGGRNTYGDDMYDGADDYDDFM